MPLGYIILDINTREPDWDATVHKTREDAVESLTGHRQPYSRAFAPEDDIRPRWANHYIIARVEKDQ